MAAWKLLRQRQRICVMVMVNGGAWASLNSRHSQSTAIAIVFILALYLAEPIKPRRNLANANLTIGAYDYIFGFALALNLSIL